MSEMEELNKECTGTDPIVPAEAEPKEEEHACSNPGIAVETYSLENMRNKISDIEIDLVAQEHRTSHVFRNLFSAILKGKDVDPEELKATIGALVGWIFFGRPVIMTLALGGLATAILALQANLLLSEQNRKLEIQNHLILVQSHQLEAQRNINLGQQLPDLLAEIRRTKKECPGVVSPSYCIADGLQRRISSFSRILQPYRIVEDDQPLNQIFPKFRRGKLSSLIQKLTGGEHTAGTGVDDVPVPVVSASRFSHERGQLLLGIANERIRNFGTFGQGTIGAPQISFEYSYLPTGTVLMTSDLSFVDLRGSCLRGVEMDSAVAVHSHFQGADLRDADFSFAMLSDTKFREADLARADFLGADLTGSDLSLANLSDAHFRDANLTNAELMFANLRGAILDNAIGISKEQLNWSCLNKESLLPAVADFSWGEYQELPGCSALWGTYQPKEQWRDLADEQPSPGAQVRVKVEASHPQEHFVSIETSGFWTGESFRAKDLGEIMGTKIGESYARITHWQEIQKNYPLARDSELKRGCIQDGS